MTSTQEAPPRGAEATAPPSPADIAEDAFWTARLAGAEPAAAWAAAARAVSEAQAKPGSIFRMTIDGLERVTAELNEARNQLAADAASYREDITGLIRKCDDYSARIRDLEKRLSAARRALERIADGDPGHVTIAVEALRASGAAQTCPGGC